MRDGYNDVYARILFGEIGDPSDRMCVVNGIYAVVVLLKMGNSCFRV